MGQPLNLGPNLTYFALTPLSGQTSLQLTPYSARGLSQTLEPMTGVNASGEAAGTWLRRDINGNLIDLSSPRLRKYVSDVSCLDTEMPMLDGAWIGQIAQVDCACELSYPSGATPQRTPVPGSPRTVGGVVYYRPQLVMMVSSIKPNFEEYKGSYAWRLRLIEV